MTDTNIKHNFSIPVILLHFLLLTVIIIPYNALFKIYLPQQDTYQIILYYGLLTFEACAIFLIFPFRKKLKVDKLPFILIILASIFNVLDLFLTILFIIEDLTPAPHAPYLEIFYKYISIFDYLPLPTYLAGYINKKLFWTIASITIAGFAFSFIWTFFIDRFLH